MSNVTSQNLSFPGFTLCFLSHSILKRRNCRNIGKLCRAESLKLTVPETTSCSVAQNWVPLLFSGDFLWTFCFCPMFQCRLFSEAGVAKPVLVGCLWVTNGSEFHKSWLTHWFYQVACVQVICVCQLQKADAAASLKKVQNALQKMADLSEEVSSRRGFSDVLLFSVGAGGRPASCKHNDFCQRVFCLCHWNCT